MKPVFAVQVTNRDDAEIALTVEALNRLGYEWINFGLIPFTTEITNLEAFPKDRIVIPLSGTKLMGMWQEGILPENWRIWYKESLMDQFFVRGVLRGHMLNQSSRIIKYKHAVGMEFSEDCFVKPSSDFKVFAGTMLPAGTTLRRYLETVTHEEIDDSENILVAPVRSIDREFRCFVVDNRVVDISEYRSVAGIKAKTVDSLTRNLLSDYVHSLAVSIPLASVDVCEVLDNDGSVKDLKIVEINCFHCSGMYLVDRARVFEALVKAIEDGRI